MSVKNRYKLSAFKAVHNFVTKENGLDLSNPFSGVHIETAQYTSKKRLPINNEDINLIQGRCLESNDPSLPRPNL